uniref:Uncharacterized protein n=1 Tax=Moniliophthora roreri TaxID=221103 RepID=A0A0W0FD48_MONRR
MYSQSEGAELLEYLCPQVF